MNLEEVFASYSRSLNNLFGFSNQLFGELIISILILAFFIFLGWLISFIFKHYFLKFAKHTKTILDDEIIRNVKGPIYVLVIFFGIYFFMHNISFINQYFNLTQTSIVDGEEITKNVFDLSEIFLLVEILLIAYIFTRVTNVIFAWFAERQENKKKTSQHILFVLRAVFNVIIYLIAFFVFLAFSGIDLAGLAIGGAATAIIIGFALQSILGDFFSAFSIYFDKPFELGDYIVVGDYSGTVTKIGMKSTRVELLQGEELILSNKELTAASIRNFKKMKKRRIAFSFGVKYDTPNKKLKKIPEIIQSIIDPEKLEYVDKLDRVHFSEFGDFSLKFDVVYYLNTHDFIKYKDTQQAINFAIREVFEKEDIEMAFPTQTIFLEK